MKTEKAVKLQAYRLFYNKIITDIKQESLKLFKAEFPTLTNFAEMYNDKQHFAFLIDYFNELEEVLKQNDELKLNAPLEFNFKISEVFNAISELKKCKRIILAHSSNHVYKAIFINENEKQVRIELESTGYENWKFINFNHWAKINIEEETRGGTYKLYDRKTAKSIVEKNTYKKGLSDFVIQCLS